MAETTGGTTVTPYNLRVPQISEVAEVPQDLENLAFSIQRALDTKLTASTASTTYQSRIQVVVGTSVSALPATAPEGTVIFLVAP